MIISIGYGRALFDAHNSERARMVASAAQVERVHHIVFTSQTHGCERQDDGTITFHPTASRSKITMIVDAYRIGSRLIASSPGTSIVLTAQDPLYAGIVGYALKLRYRLPLLIQEHADMFSGPYWRNESLVHRVLFPLARFLVHRADRVRAVSSRVAQHLASLGIPPERIVVLPVLHSTTVRAVSRTKKSTDTITILSVLRFVPQKNIMLLIQGFAQAYRERKEARLILVGSGVVRTEAEALVAALNLSSVVTFLPWSTDVYSLMAEADIYALTSNYEGWGRVLIEAMESGLPILTTDVGCVDEVCIRNRHCVVIQVGDTPSSCAHALQTLLTDSSLRTRYGEAGREDIRVFLDTQHDYARRWARMFEFHG